jgi:hypothetical protein
MRAKRPALLLGREKAPFLLDSEEAKPDVSTDLIRTCTDYSYSARVSRALCLVRFSGECTVSRIMVTSPAVSWLFFKARAKHPYLSHTGRASNAEKQPTGAGPEGCVENEPAAALLVGYVSIQICALLAPCRRPILNATTSPLFARRCTRDPKVFPEPF